MNAEHGSQDRVRVVLFGLGSVGSAASRLCAKRPWIDLAGAVVRSPGPRRAALTDLRVIPSSESDAALDEIQPDIALIATRPTISEVLPDIERCARRGIHVICTSEELAFPAVSVDGSIGGDIDGLPASQVLSSLPQASIPGSYSTLCHSRYPARHGTSITSTYHGLSTPRCSA